MDWQTVKSSNVDAIAYDEATQTLSVRFKRGGHVYEYQGVSPAKHAQLMNAASIGNHLHNYIRPYHAHGRV